MQDRHDSERLYGSDGFRTLRCPRCGHRLVDVAAGTSGSIRIKCRKCKFQGILDLFCLKNYILVIILILIQYFVML